MLWVAGIDGCRAGWVVVLVDVREQNCHRHHLRLCQRFDDVLALCPRPTVIAIDIPIGLLSESEPGGRECDRHARKLLKRRASSVFTPPSRRLLPATSYEQVRTQGMSRQTFGIVPKIREVDRLMTPVLQQTIREAHPELAFMSLTGMPMRHNKKTPAGREERLQALIQASNPRWQTIRQALTQSFGMFPRSHVAPDDILDAYVLTWIAYRIATAQANRLPPHPAVDARGLGMEIWY